MTTRAWLLISLSAATSLTVGCADGTGETGAGVAEEPLYESSGIPEEALHLIQHAERCNAGELDRVFTVHHYVRVGNGRRVHVTETFTVRSWLRWPHRGVLLLPGTISVGSFYNLDVDGYRFADTLAQNGYFAFAVDYEGSGESTYPANGYDVDNDYIVASLRPVINALRVIRLVPRLDVLGESNGGSIATELCDNRRAVRSCVMSSMLYVDGTDFYHAVFLDPGFVFFLTHQPDGYLTTGPELYFNIASRMSPEVAAAALATQPGRYALGHVVDGFGPLPWFDPTHAQVPGLIIQGTEDNIATQLDADLLAADYGSASDGGGHATVVRIEGGGIIPRVEPAPINEMWTDAVLDFLD